jgi:pimeloyl-ACP methyl ester carboxylesterase
MSMVDSGIRRVIVPDAALEVEVRGSGEPVVLIQTALIADEFEPIASTLGLRADHTIVLYHRRGYAGSSPVQGPGSIPRDAIDCQRLLAELRIERAHVVGLSYSGAVALQLAADAPECVHSVCLIEPPPAHIPSAREFLAANRQFIDYHRRHGPEAALDLFLTRLIGPDWRHDIEQHLPDGAAQVERDAGTFFATDLPALSAWRFSGEDARRITQPVLYLGGTASGPWFAEVHQLILAWLPQAEDVMIPGAGHFLALTHASQAATAIASFLQRHRISA